jgi:site-specific recombinase XerD
MNCQTAHFHVKNACEKAGITDDRTHSHTLKHAFSINCILQSVPVTVLKEWLGHRDITKTLIYTAILASDTRAFTENVRL